MFNDNWNKESLGNLGEIVSGLTYSPKNVVDDGTLVLRSSNVKNRQTVLDDKVYVDTSNLKYNPLKKKDILICVRNGSKRLIGKNALISDECIGEAFGAFMTVYRSKHNKFLFQYFDTDSYKSNVYRNLGARINSINKKELEKFQLYLPNAKEEQKIADFLEAVDVFILNLTKQKEKLEEYKKGIMQKIFSQEIRFKDKNGKDYPDWKFLRLDTIFSKKNTKNTDGKTVEVLTNSAAEGIVSQASFFDKEIAVKGNTNNYYIVDIDDFVYNPRISKLAPVGPMKRNTIHKGIMSPLYTVLQCKKGNLSFLEFFFETTVWHKYMTKISNFGARHDRMNIRNEDLMALPVAFPCISEQQSIVNFLEQIKEGIEQNKKQLLLLQKWKKGLLQKMFV